MVDECRVWISTRKNKGRNSYHLRWIDSETGKWRSQRAGTDRKSVLDKANKLQARLTEGTYRDAASTSWVEVTRIYLSLLETPVYAKSVDQTLTEFGRMMRPISVQAVTMAMIREYVVALSAKGLKGATVNKKIRHLYTVLEYAVDEDYLAENPMHKKSSRKKLLRIEEKHEPRTLTDAEETTVLETSKRLYGFHWWAMVYMLLATGVRRAELTDLTWDCVELDGPDPHVRLIKTKTHLDRVVPLNSEAVDVLRRVQVQMLQQPGPFTGMHGKFSNRWSRIVRIAGLKNAEKAHCLRKTFISRLVRAGVPLPTISKLAGTSVKLIEKVYNEVTADDKRAAIRKLERGVG